MKIKPHGLFRVWSPDDVAECIDGVPDDLYRKLWSLVEDLPERNECNDNFSDRCLAAPKRWKTFTPDEQAKLNELANVEHGDLK